MTLRPALRSDAHIVVLHSQTELLVMLLLKISITVMNLLKIDVNWQEETRCYLTDHMFIFVDIYRSVLFFNLSAKRSGKVVARYCDTTENDFVIV